MSSIVLMEMRDHSRSYGGKSRPTKMPRCSLAARKSPAGMPVLAKMKLACESVVAMSLEANQSSVNWRAAVLRSASCAMRSGFSIEVLAPRSDGMLRLSP